MQTFKQGDIVRVPFPYTDKATRQHRPALIISSRSIGANSALLWVAMITSAENRSWPGDVAIKHFETAGLPAASVIRTAKIATVETRHTQIAGDIDKATLDAAMSCIKTNLSNTNIKT